MQIEKGRPFPDAIQCPDLFLGGFHNVAAGRCQREHESWRKTRAVHLWPGVSQACEKSEDFGFKYWLCLSYVCDLRKIIPFP